MLESEVVEVDGVFVGAAIMQADRCGHAFFATHERVRSMHGVVMPNLATIRHQATRHYRGGCSTAEQIVGSWVSPGPRCDAVTSPPLPLS